MVIEITNSGYDRNTVCYQHHLLSKQILADIIQNDAWFAYISTLDPCERCAAAGRTSPNDECGQCDDWRDERTWLKANPGLDTILPRDYLREQVAEAVEMASKENIVRRLNFCQWTEQAVRWLSMSDWDACPKTLPQLEALRTRVCYGGLDLSTKIDLTAWALVFPPSTTDSNWVLLVRYFVPEENVRPREQRDRVPYSVWIRSGAIIATPGNVVDYDTIEKQIIEDSRMFRGLQDIGFDPWNATASANHLTAAGLKMIETRQGTATMSEPAKEFEAALRAKKLNHGANPVLRWNAANVSVKRDHNDNYMPDKERSTERIDGIVAALIAFARAVRNQPQQPSIYLQRGIFRL
jgi:phage terminase large subunit-like protein